MYIQRKIESDVLKSLNKNPVTAVIGPRQCGKSTLVKHLIADRKDIVFLDLERPSDLDKLENSEWFLSLQKGKLICIDEIQRKPDLFPLIRSLVDEWGNNGHFLVLGSSSRDLLKQSSESLAGRISYKHLTPFLYSEIKDWVKVSEYLTKGGFPRALLEKDEKDSINWRDDFITTFLERDLLQWAGFQPIKMRRLWQMLAHNNGQTVNYTALGNSLGITNVTIKNYIDLLEGTFMLDIVQPYFSNQKKRIVKSPKIYVSDSGILSNLLNISDFNALIGHPAFGATWEQVVLMQLKARYQQATISHYRSSNGAEIDFIVELKGKTIAIECKSTKTPKLAKGFFNAREDVKADYSYIVAPVDEPWPMAPNIEVTNLSGLENLNFH